jgi:hypothetical protein
MTVRKERFRVGYERGSGSRFTAIVCAFAVLLLAPSALASAPMCNEHGQTIEAPLPVFPAKGGEIRATPSCDFGGAKLSPALPLGERSQLQASADGLERVLPLSLILPPLPVGELLPVGLSRLAAPAGGLSSGVYRPPRA